MARRPAMGTMARLAIGGALGVLLATAKYIPNSWDAGGFSI